MLMSPRLVLALSLALFNGEALGLVCPECSSDADCTFDAALPVCDTVNSECVECNADADCTDATESSCNTEAHTCAQPCTHQNQCTADPAHIKCAKADHLLCVECVGNANCPSDKPVCLNGGGSYECVECVANSNCVTAPNTLCNTNENKCAQCKADAHCTGSQRCSDFALACVDCLVDADCSSPTPACVNCAVSASPTETCVECTSDSHCTTDAALPACDTGSWTCVECTLDSHCTSDPALPTCDTGSFTCVATSTAQVRMFDSDFEGEEEEEEEEVLSWNMQ